MGYVAKVVSAENVKNAIAGLVPFSYVTTTKVNGTTYGPLIKATLNFTYIDRLICICTCRAAGGNCIIKATANANVLVETGGSVDGTVERMTWDCTALTGEQVFTIEIKCSVANLVWLDDLLFYNREV